MGPLVPLAVARRQFNATVLSANRQKWIETLPDALAELIPRLVAALVIKSQWPGSWDKGMGAIAAHPELLANLERIVVVPWKIRLLMNPTEPDHLALHRTIEAAFRRFQAEGTSDAETEADIELTTAQAPAILKREWERVKRAI